MLFPSQEAQLRKRLRQTLERLGVIEIPDGPIPFRVEQFRQFGFLVRPRLFFLPNLLSTAEAAIDLFGQFFPCEHSVCLGYPDARSIRNSRPRPSRGYYFIIETGAAPSVKLRSVPPKDFKSPIAFANLPERIICDMAMAAAGLDHLDRGAITFCIDSCYESPTEVPGIQWLGGKALICPYRLHGATAHLGVRRVIIGDPASPLVEYSSYNPVAL